ncbi:MAG: ABC transporter permease [Halanaerobiales bacterium]
MKYFKKYYNKLKPYILLLPALTVLLGLFMGGVMMALSQSLGYFPLLGLKEITLKYYHQIWTSKEFLDALSFSLYISLTSSVLAVVIGVFLAYQLVRLPVKHRLVQLAYKIPIIVPHMVASLMVFVIFTQSGLMARILYQLGFIAGMEDFPRLIFDRNGIGVILVYIWKEIPFIALMTYSVLKHVNGLWEDVAYNLGASKRQVFWHIYLPLAAPSIGSAFIIIFAFSLGAFEIPFLLGPTYPQTLPVMAYQKYVSLDLLQRPYAMVITMTLAIISFILIYLYNRLMKWVFDYET